MNVSCSRNFKDMNLKYMTRFLHLENIRYRQFLWCRVLVYLRTSRSQSGRKKLLLVLKIFTTSFYLRKSRNDISVQFQNRVFILQLIPPQLKKNLNTCFYYKKQVKISLDHFLFEKKYILL